MAGGYVDRNRFLDCNWLSLKGATVAKLFPKSQLPHYHSTRDTRDRLDLIKDAVPVGATQINADRVIYHPGDTAARHYHTDCHHLFYVLDGEGLIHVGEGSYHLSPGMVAIVGPGEVHWFENNAEANFSFVEFWAPPPKETIWVKRDDV
jgi:quercetin dioxygenase-like cupin family protein